MNRKISEFCQFVYYLISTMDRQTQKILNIPRCKYGEKYFGVNSYFYKVVAWALRNLLAERNDLF